MPHRVIIVSSCHVNIVSLANPSEWDVSTSLASLITRDTRHQSPGWGLLASSCHQAVISLSLVSELRVWLLKCLDIEVCWVALVLHNGWPGSRIRNQYSQYLINWVTSKVNSLQIFGFLTISEFDMFSVHSGSANPPQHGQPWLVRQVSIYPREMYI